MTTLRGTNLSTVGVDVGDWTFQRKRGKNGKVTFSTWDFGGQVCPPWDGGGVGDIGESKGERPQIKVGGYQLIYSRCGRQRLDVSVEEREE